MLLDEIVKTSRPLAKDCEKKPSASVDVHNMTCYWDKVVTSSYAHPHVYLSLSFMEQTLCRVWTPLRC